MKGSRLAGLVIVLFLISGCAPVRLVSEYDAYTDKNVTKVQRQVETLFTSLDRGAEMPECLHAAYEAKYADMQVELNLLLARNKTRPNNAITTEQLRLLASSMQDLEALHRLADSEDRCLTVDDVVALRSAFDVSFGAVLKFEIAKRDARLSP